MKRAVTSILVCMLVACSQQPVNMTALAVQDAAEMCGRFGQRLVSMNKLEIEPGTAHFKFGATCSKGAEVYAHGEIDKGVIIAFDRSYYFALVGEGN